MQVQKTITDCGHERLDSPVMVSSCEVFLCKKCAENMAKILMASYDKERCCCNKI